MLLKRNEIPTYAPVNKLKRRRCICRELINLINGQLEFVTSDQSKPGSESPGPCPAPLWSPPFFIKAHEFGSMEREKNNSDSYLHQLPGCPFTRNPFTRRSCVSCPVNTYILGSSSLQIPTTVCPLRALDRAAEGPGHRRVDHPLYGQCKVYICPYGVSSRRIRDVISSIYRTCLVA